MRRTQNDNFPTVHTEGILLPPDILARIAAPKSGLEGLAPTDYHLPEGERTNDAVNRSWNRLLALWNNFRTAMEALPENDAALGITRDRWLLPLFQELGYGRLQRHNAVTIGNKSYPISHIWERTPIHLVGARIDMDKRTPGQAGAAQSSPHSLVQEFLNRSDDHLWAFLSNGLKLRILRDNLSLVKQAYVEFDLEAMMDGELYADFRLLWLLCHESRVEGERPELCWLEKWTQTAREQGARALEQLREGVETAIAALGSGYLSHPANRALLDKLADGSLGAQDYYRQLLRLVYRLIFLFVAEDRDLLLDPDAAEDVRERYLEFYSTRRLRQLAGRLRGSRHDDLFESLKVVMQRLHEQGSPELALPVLGSFLWSPEKIEDLEGLRIRNRDFLEAIRGLAFSKHNHALRPIDYRNLGSEELGSVYESLLELHPELHKEAGTFELKTAAGHERKTTGSYYTPASLINELLNSALEPVLHEAAAKENPEQAILDLNVCDPAVGSGHFLVAAAHRIARRLAAVRTGDEEPAPSELNHALRDVVGHCLYGVDANEMAVELCKVSLWMTGMERGRPLSFLDHRIRCGNSLLGTTPALMAKGIPDEAFKAIASDNKEYCKKYKAQNKRERESRTKDMFGHEEDAHEEYCRLRDAVSKINTLVDSDVEGVKKQAAVYEAVMNSDECKYSHLVADAWCAAFFFEKNEEAGFQYSITEAVFRRLEEEPEKCPAWLQDEIQRLSKQYKYFHWHLEFPDVFWVVHDGGRSYEEKRELHSGFDVVLGNPPWEVLEDEEKKFFASDRSDIANAATSKRKQLIERLATEDVNLYTAWNKFRDERSRFKSFHRESQRFPLSSYKKLNLYASFLELNLSLTSVGGYCGMIVQSGLATDESRRYLFNCLFQKKRLRSLFDFENIEGLFPGVHPQQKFSLVTFSGTPQDAPARLSFYNTQLSHLSDVDRIFFMTPEDMRRMSPNTGACPTFRSHRDAEIVRRMYANAPVFHDESSEPQWAFKFQQMFNSSSDEHLFEKWLPGAINGSPWEIRGSMEKRGFLQVYEGKYIGHFNHRLGTFYHRTEPEVARGAERALSYSELQDPSECVTSRWWVNVEHVRHRTIEFQPNRKWFFGFCDIANPQNVRTATASIMPYSGATDTVWLLLGEDDPLTVSTLCAMINSFPFDFVTRRRIGSRHLKKFVFKQLPFISGRILKQDVLWDRCALDAWISTRVLELVYTGLDLKSFAVELGYEGNPFAWNESRRVLLACEIDAAFFHLYGISRDDVDYIMETFPIVKKRDIEKHGHYFTKQTILGIFDKLKISIETGQPYQTLLDPPPAASSVAHPPRAAEKQSA